MGARIPQSTRSFVIQKWLSGTARDRIAADCGLSGGAVSGIIADWRLMVGSDLADQLREVAIALRKRSLTPLECATALRFVNIMSNLGVKEESFESFISEIYTRCVGIGLDPKQISSYLTELVAFWSAKRVEEERQADGIRPFSEIPGYIASLKEEKIQLQDDIYKLRAEARDLNGKRSEAERQLAQRLRDNAITAQQLDWYAEVKMDLRRMGLDVNKVKEFVFAVRWVSENNANLVSVIKQFHSYNDIFQGVIFMKETMAALKQEKIELEKAIKAHHLKLDEIEDLKSLGFGLRELRFLHQTLKEVGEENNNASDNESVTKFLTDIENDYDALTGFKTRLDVLKNECIKLNEERNRQIAKVGAIPYLGTILSSLLRKGLTEDDIFQVAILLHDHPDFADTWIKSKFKPKPDAAKDDDDNAPIQRDGPDVVIPSPHTEDRKDTRAGNIGHPNPPRVPKGSYPHDTGQPSEIEPAELEAPQGETYLVRFVDGVYIPYYPGPNRSAYKDHYHE